MMLSVYVQYFQHVSTGKFPVLSHWKRVSDKHWFMMFCHYLILNPLELHKVLHKQ